MNDSINLIFDKDGVAREYDDTYDITIHCESQEEQDKVWATLNRRWIPCSEKLLEENGRYLVTRGLNACGSLWNRVYIANYSNLMGIRSKRIWWQGNVGKSDFEQLNDVLAWMPMPEVYGGESDENT